MPSSWPRAPTGSPTSPPARRPRPDGARRALMPDFGITEASAPERRCIVTGEVMPQARLIRFVAGPAGEIVPDVAGNLPGRGLWLTARHDIVERAVAKRLFA